MQTGPGKWTIEEKEDPTVRFAAANEGPSLRDLMGGDVNLSMSGELQFGPEHMSPREAPDYARKYISKAPQTGGFPTLRIHF